MPVSGDASRRERSEDSEEGDAPDGARPVAAYVWNRDRRPDSGIEPVTGRCVRGSDAGSARGPRLRAGGSVPGVLGSAPRRSPSSICCMSGDCEMALDSIERGVPLVRARRPVTNAGSTPRPADARDGLSDMPGPVLPDVLRACAARASGSLLRCAAIAMGVSECGGARLGPGASARLPALAACSWGRTRNSACSR